ncbi:MAG: hypothetical protein AAGD06_26060 [Acidobacteriota bacterium]
MSPNLSRAIPVLLAIVATTVAVLPSLAEAISQSALAGRWQGVLVAGEHELRIVFHVEGKDDQSLKATLDSPDQGALEIPIAAVRVDGSSVRFEIRVLNATFAGELDKEQRAIEGDWEQAGLTFPMTVTKATTESAEP